MEKSRVDIYKNGLIKPFFILGILPKCCKRKGLTRVKGGVK